MERSVGRGLLPMKRAWTICAVAVFLMFAPQALAQPAATPNLEGLWKAERVFGPRARGPLVIRRIGARTIAEIAGRRVEVRREGGELVFALPNGEGDFH